ncbi:MAG: prephenate dehydrogenase/arogenate dehydrogenase family protein [bacterium]
MKSAFEKITLVGMGLLAGSLAAMLKRKGYSGNIVGVSRKNTIDQASAMGLISEGYEYHELSKGVHKSDLVILCTPINNIIELIKELGANPQWLKPGCLITDIGSTKADITDTVKKHINSSIYFIGGHPMAGSEKRGINNLDPFLYENSICVLTPCINTPQDKIDELSSFWTSLGAKVKIMGAHTHDRIAAAISHLPQILAVSLVNMIGKLNQRDNNYLTLAAGGFRDMTRIASSGYAMWGDIFSTNKTELRHAISSYIEKLSEIQQNLENDCLQPEFENAANTRLNIPIDSKGFISRLFEILVVVEDKPGVIAAISSILAEREINIKDIEVLKVREGEGGTLRLAFESLEIAKKAVKILEQSKISARLRNE